MAEALDRPVLYVSDDMKHFEATAAETAYLHDPLVQVDFDDRRERTYRRLTGNRLRLLAMRVTPDNQADWADVRAWAEARIGAERVAQLLAASN